MRPWNTYLPYRDAALHAQHGAELLVDIKQGLAQAIKTGDLAIGATYTAQALEDYMILKYPLTLSDRIWFTKIMFQLTTLPGLDLHLVHVFSCITCKLIKNKELLPSNTLILDGWALEKMLSRSFFPKQKDHVLPSASKIVGSIVRLSSLAQRFFSAEFATQLLHKYLPRINVNYLPSMVTHMSILSLLLPANVVPSPPPEMDASDSLAYNPKVFWIPTLFSIWLMVVNVPTFDMLFIDIFGRVAEEHLATPENASWTDDQIRVVFTIGMRNLGLPVGSGTSGLEHMPIRKENLMSASQHSDAENNVQLMKGMSKSNVEYFSKFIVYTIFPSQPGCDRYSTMTLEHLEMLIQAISGFCHPSNTGKWSFPISNFIKQLSQDFLSRCELENKSGSKIPEHYKLNVEIKRRFVVILRDIVFLGMFGKDSRAVAYSNITFKYLSWIDPASTFPGLLERVFPALESLNETHRTISCISALNSTALPLVSCAHYPSGGKDLISLLHLTLPGLDINDIAKSTSTLLFINSAIMTVPLFDVFLFPCNDSTTFSDMNNDAMELRDIHEERRLSTSEFESWTCQYLERVFSILENLPQQYGSNGGSKMTMENSLLDMLLYTSDMVFSQLSEPLEDSIIRKIVRFCCSSVLPTATKAIGTLCGSLSRSQPRKRLTALFPICRAGIFEEISNGAASRPCSKISAASNPFGFAFMSDASLHWYQSILNSIVHYSGDDILDFQEDIIAIIDESITKCASRRGYKWAGKLLRNVLFSLTHSYPIEARSHPQSLWNSPEFQKSSHMHWGDQFTLETADVKWHTPSSKGIAFAEALLKRYTSLAISKLEAAMAMSVASADHSFGTDIGKWLSLLKNCAYGSGTLLQPPTSISHNNEIPDLEMYVPRVHRRPPYAGACFTDPTTPKFSEWALNQEHIQDIVYRLYSAMSLGRTNDSEAIQSLVSCIEACISYTGVYVPFFASSMRLYKYMKGSIKISDNQVLMPRYLIAQRARLVHLARLKQVSVQRPMTTLVHRLIVDVLTPLCVSEYTPVRVRAQRALEEALRCFPVARFSILPILLSYLDVSRLGTEHASDQIKGTLHVLRGKSITSVILHHWKYTSLFLKAIVRSQHDDKPTILEMLRKAYIGFLMHTSGVSFSPPPATISLLELAGDCGVDTTDVVISEGYLERRRQLAQSEYHGLVDSLVSFAQDSSTHWRFSAMAANLVDVILRPEESISPSLMRFAVANVTNEHPIMRNNCVSLLTRILIILKQRATQQGTSSIALLKKDVVYSSAPFSLQDDSQLLEDTLFNDQLDSGWLSCDGVQTVYTGVRRPDDLSPAFHDSSSSEAHSILDARLKESEFWSLIASYLSQEMSHTTDFFSNATANLFKRVAGLVEDALIKHLGPFIESWIDQSSDKSMQRAAAEVLGGILRGAKHWASTKQSLLWSWATPLLSRAFSQATTDSIGYWMECVKYISLARDPRRIRPLVQLIFQAQLDPSSHSFFYETKKLFLVRSLVAVYSSHLRMVAQHYLPLYFSAICSPYAQVRDTLGALINQLLQIQWCPNAKNTTSLFLAYIRQWSNTSQNAATLVSQDGVAVPGGVKKNTTDVISTPTLPHYQPSELLLKLLNTDMPKWRLEPRDTVTSYSSYGNASKTLLAMLTDGLLSYRVSGLYPHLLALLPELFEMQEFCDFDLQTSASHVGKLYSNFHHTTALLVESLSKLVELLGQQSSPTVKSTPESSEPPFESKDGSSISGHTWHRKVRVMPVIQVLFFRHLHLIPPILIDRIIFGVTECLGDFQVEVRQMASVTLGGLVRCYPNPKLISTLSADFLLKLKTTNKRRVPEIVESKMSPKASVTAFPYNVPLWMPDILVVLSTCISDSAPSRATVSKTFADFKRTHHDNWEMDKQMFSEDQLTILSDLLISPGYYA
ncbi:hypothetical protein BASA60_010024 [Batrachochytrium salamandrivorans]|nr:hypothetical protein BASA60_010024 [Batrachochytrium salamandrivorans]